MFVQYSDGSYDGLPAVYWYYYDVYDKREWGNRFTTSSDVKLNVRGIAFCFHKITSPPGDARFRLYRGTDLIATTYGVPPDKVVSGAWYPAYFPDTQILLPSTTYRAVIGTSYGGDYSNKYTVYGFELRNRLDAVPLLPFGGTLQATYTEDYTANPPVFTDIQTVIVPFALILDTDDEFAPAGGGGGLLVHPGMTGGMRG